MENNQYDELLKKYNELLVKHNETIQLLFNMNHNFFELKSDHTRLVNSLMNSNVITSDYNKDTNVNSQ